MPPKQPNARMGRPPTWYTKIDAPAEAIELYTLIGKLQGSEAFRACHPYSGLTEKGTGIPLFRFEGKVHAMPYVISSFMGLEFGDKLCQTPGCMNPFHYAPPSERIRPELLSFTPPPAVGDDWQDLIDYYVEEKGCALDYETLRAEIPPEDITDLNLAAAIETYKKEKL